MLHIMQNEVLSLSPKKLFHSTRKRVKSTYNSTFSETSATTNLQSQTIQSMDQQQHNHHHQEAGVRSISTYSPEKTNNSKRRYSTASSIKSLFSHHRRSEDSIYSFSSKSSNKRQGLIFGTESSGKKSVLKFMKKCKNFAKLEVGPVINYDYDISLNHYKNMLYQQECCEFMVFVFDCSLISVDYLYRVCILINGLIEEYRCIRTMRKEENDEYEEQQKELKILIYMNKLDLTEYNLTSTLIERTLGLKKHSDINYLILPSDASQNLGISEGVNWLLT